MPIVAPASTITPEDRNQTTHEIAEDRGTERRLLLSEFLAVITSLLACHLWFL